MLKNSLLLKTLSLVQIQKAPTLASAFAIWCAASDEANKFLFA